MIRRIRRRLVERRLLQLNAQLEAHCGECRHCAVIAWGNRQQKRKAGNSTYCHRGQAILLQLDETLLRLHALYPEGGPKLELQRDTRDASQPGRIA